MAVKNKKNAVNPLNWKVPIVSKDGTPTPEFMQKWTQQGTTNAGIPDLTTAAGVSAVLDTLGLVQGDILYRDAAQWKVLAPGTLGFILKAGGAAANPAWESVSAALDGLGSVQGDILYRSGSAWTVLAPGTNGQLLSYNSTSHAPQWSSIVGVLLGSGAPASLQPAGTLYSRTDTAGVYSSQPVGAAPSVVQHKSLIQTSSIPGVVTLTGAPTPGNLILAFIAYGDNASVQPTVDTTKWTQFITATGTGSNIRGFAVYRYAQIGDVAALPAFCTAGSDYWAAAVYEVNSVTGTFGTDVILSEGAGQTGSAVVVTGNQLTVNANDLAIIAGGQYDGTTNPTISAPWVSDESANNAANFGSIVGGHRTVAAPATINGTLTFNQTTHSATGFQVVVANTGALVANWVLVGPQVIPVGANPSATGSDVAVNGAAATFMRSDGAPAIQKASSSVFGLSKVDNQTITATGGVISGKLSPVFQAQLGVAQGIVAATYTKVHLDTVLIDTGGYWDAVNFRYTPQIAGTYLVAGGVETTISAAAALTLSFCLICKNGLAGTTYSKNLLQVPSSVNVMSMPLPIGFATMNGTTDFIELFGRADSTGGGNPGIGNDQNTCLSIVRIGP